MRLTILFKVLLDTKSVTIDFSFKRKKSKKVSMVAFIRTEASKPYWSLSTYRLFSTEYVIFQQNLEPAMAHITRKHRSFWPRQQEMCSAEERKIEFIHFEEEHFWHRNSKSSFTYLDCARAKPRTLISWISKYMPKQRSTLLYRCFTWSRTL